MPASLWWLMVSQPGVTVASKQPATHAVWLCKGRDHPTSLRGKKRLAEKRRQGRGGTAREVTLNYKQGYGCFSLLSLSFSLHSLPILPSFLSLSTLRAPVCTPHNIACSQRLSNMVLVANDSTFTATGSLSVCVCLCVCVCMCV